MSDVPTRADAPASPATGPETGPYTLRPMDWDDLPRLAAMGEDGPDPFTHDDLAKVLESQYTLGVVCATPTGPAGYMIYAVSDGTGATARGSGKLTLAAGVVRVVVAPERRRQGVGRFLVEKVSEALVRQFSQKAATGRLRLHSTVNETWLPGLLFLKGLGFRTPTDKSRAILPRPFGAGCEYDGYHMERIVAWSAPHLRRGDSVACEGPVADAARVQ